MWESLAAFPFYFLENKLISFQLYFTLSINYSSINFVINDLEIDTTAKRVWRGGREIFLTTKEYTLLEYLVRENGKVVGRAEISEHVWDENFDVSSNLIEVYIKRLRSKMDEGFSVRLIHTRRGAGYILESNV
ncbi:MAG: winged helix-turn-helix domain-containing protein [Pyrinomonadaceae bacterium]